MPQERVVICMKWGTLYPSSYVNVLYAACREYITGEFRFVCLTDDASGIRSEVETFPIPDMNITDFDWKKGGWPKLVVFQKDLYGIKGRGLFVDLDTVICGELDSFFERSDADIITLDSSENWKSDNANAIAKCMTSVFAFTFDQHPEIWEHFIQNRAEVVKAHRIEQVYLQAIHPQMGFWDRRKAISFKYFLRRSVFAQMLIEPRRPSIENSLIIFHGEPRPIDLTKSKWWGIFPHVGKGPVSWMKEYWTRFGGDA